MRRYETIFISDSDLTEDDRNQLFEKTKDLIDAQGGSLLIFDDWGARKLAYEIKKKGRGYYVRLDYCGDGKLVAEMERSFRIDDRVLKYMTIVLDADVDPEKIKQELAEESEEAAEVEETSEQKPAAEEGETKEAKEAEESTSSE